MKPMWKCLLVIIAFGLTEVTTESAQWRLGRGKGGWGPESAYGRMFDVKTVQTLTGEIVKIERITPKKGMQQGVHLQLKTDTETLSVHLGPAWYIDNQELQLVKGEKIEVKGSRVSIEEKSTIIAAEVRRGDDVLKLRDETGRPFWAAWRRK